HCSIYSVVVINVRHLRDSHHARVRNVHVLHVTRTAAVAGHPHITWTERKPCDSRHTGPKADRYPESAAAHKRDERWSIDRPHNERPGHPPPVAAYERPAPVVKWGGAPRFVANPSPAPGRDPDPVSEVIGRPACSDAPRNPHAAVLRNHLPIAVVIQIVVTVDIARHILRRRCAVFPLVALLTPALEIIKARSLLSVVGQLIGSVKCV